MDDEIQKRSSRHPLTIAEMAFKYKISLRSLRFYEQKGLLRPWRANNSRMYSHQEELKLQIIIKGKRLGLSLAEIERFLPYATLNASNVDVISHMDLAEIEWRIASLVEKRDVIDAAIEELLEQKGRTE